MVDGTQWVLTISKMNDKECTVGLKYASEYEQKYERYSILSLLNWVRLETEPSLKHQSSSLITVQSMILSATKSNTNLRSLCVMDMKSTLNVEVYF
jgi:hypothetical protein